jgi:hypothetical protein
MTADNSLRQVQTIDRLAGVTASAIEFMFGSAFNAHHDAIDPKRNGQCKLTLQMLGELSPYYNDEFGDTHSLIFAHTADLP